MNVEAIGNWAGLVWQALDEADVLGVKQIKTRRNSSFRLSRNNTPLEDKLIEPDCLYL